MLRLAFQNIIGLLCASTIYSAAALEVDPDSATLIDHLIYINGMIEERCGERIDVVWVDERGENPPCTMTYSKSCSEAQTHNPNSCIVMMRTLAD